MAVGVNSYLNKKNNKETCLKSYEILVIFHYIAPKGKKIHANECKCDKRFFNLCNRYLK